MGVYWFFPSDGSCKSWDLLCSPPPKVLEAGRPGASRSRLIALVFVCMCVPSLSLSVLGWYHRLAATCMMVPSRADHTHPILPCCPVFFVSAASHLRRLHSTSSRPLIESSRPSSCAVFLRCRPQFPTSSYAPGLSVANPRRAPAAAQHRATLPSAAVPRGPVTG